MDEQPFHQENDVIDSILNNEFYKFEPFANKKYWEEKKTSLRLFYVFTYLLHRHSGGDDPPRDGKDVPEGEKTTRCARRKFIYPKNSQPSVMKNGRAGEALLTHICADRETKVKRRLIIWDGCGAAHVIVATDSRCLA